MPAAQPMSEVPLPRHADRGSVFEIFRNQNGRWYALRADGMVLGIFFKHEDAVRFARQECGDAASLMFITEGMERPAPAARARGWWPRLIEA